MKLSRARTDTLQCTRTYTYTLLSIMKFGKYKGNTLQDVIDDDPRYVQWCINELEWFKVDQEAKMYLQEALSEYGNYEEEIPGDYNRD